MKKVCLFLLSLLVTSSFAFALVFAATFTLDSIGTLSTDGNRYTEWWYTGASPALAGTSQEGAEITVTVNDEVSTVTTGTDGNWSLTPSGYVEGENLVVISTDEDSYAFNLTLGSSAGSTATATTETTQATVPDTGVAQVFAIFGGVVALAVGWYLLTNSKDSAFLD